MRETLKMWAERYPLGGKAIVHDGLDLNPDFQRAHVWTRDQQIKYVEYILKGGASGRDIYFNNPSWSGTYAEKTVLVDGKQRLEAAFQFLDNKIPAFGHLYSEWTGAIPFDCYFIFYVNQLKTRAEVLEWYLDINTGGTPHSEDEINRVKELLKKEKK